MLRALEHNGRGRLRRALHLGSWQARRPRARRQVCACRYTHVCVCVCARGALWHGDGYVHADIIHVCVCVCVCMCARAAPSGMVIGICMQTFLFISISLLHYSIHFHFTTALSHFISILSLCFFIAILLLLYSVHSPPFISIPLLLYSFLFPFDTNAAPPSISMHGDR